MQFFSLKGTLKTLGYITVAVAFLLPSQSYAYNSLIQYAEGTWFHMNRDTAYNPITGNPPPTSMRLGSGFTGTLASTTQLALWFQNGNADSSALTWTLLACDNSDYTGCVAGATWANMVQPVYVADGTMISGEMQGYATYTFNASKYYAFLSDGNQHADDSLFGSGGLIWFVLAGNPNSETFGVIETSQLALALSSFSTSSLPAYISSFNLSTCNPFQGEFSASTCVANLFWPNGLQWGVIKSEFEDAFLTRKPFGYVTRFIDILQDTASSSPPTIDITFPSSIFPTQMAGKSIEFSPFTAFSAGSILATATSTETGDTILEEFMPVWEFVVYLALIMAIVHDLVSHAHRRSTPKPQKQ